MTATAIVAMADFDASSSTVRRVHMIAKGLVASGRAACLVVPQRFRPGMLTGELDGLKIYWGATATSENRFTMRERIRARQAAIRLVDRLAAEGLDWLILYNLGLEGMPLLLSARRRGARVAVEYCDVRAKAKFPTMEDRVRTVWHAAADNLVPRYTDLNLAISRFLEDWLRRKAPRTPTLVVPPLVDTDRFQVRRDKADDFRRKWGIGTLPMIGYLGSYWSVEGLSGLLRAARNLDSSGLRFKLVIAGAAVPGRECDDVAALAKKLDIEPRVVQTGWLDTEEVIAAMSAADILVAPKTNDVANRAGLATKMVEYLAMGRAVVATRVGDVPLYLRDAEDCLLCEPDNEAELTDCLRRLLQDPSMRAEIGFHARRTACEQFDFRPVGRRVLEAMLRLEAGTGGRKAR